MRGVSGAFKGFDRNPYAVAFRAGKLEFTAVSVHLFFGSHAYYDEDRRALEAYALSRWADRPISATKRRGPIRGISSFWEI
jgi:hypothetical protein